MTDTRKLQKIGGSLYVSLPKQWTSQMQLEQGDNIVLNPQSDGSLYLSPSIRREKPRQITLERKEGESWQSVKRRIIAAYMDGFGIIQVKAENRLTEDQREFLNKTTRDLFGLEIIEITSNQVTMQCLLTPILPLERTLQRIHAIVSSMFTETISALKDLDAHLALGVSKRIQEVTRLSLVMHRALRSAILFPAKSKQEEVTVIDCVDYLRVLHRIVEISGDLSKIAEDIAAIDDESIPQHILDRASETCNFLCNSYNRSVEALQSMDVQLADNVLDSKITFDKLWKLCTEAEKTGKISSLTLSHTYLLINHFKEIQGYTSEIAEITIERAEAKIRKE